MNMAKSLLACLLFFPPLLGATSTKEESTKNIQELLYSWTYTFAEVLNLAETKHYKLDAKALEDGMSSALDEFLNKIDPYSNFLNQEKCKAILETTSGEFFGIGIVIDNTRQPKEKFLLISDVIPDGPSDKIGLKPMDKIVEIEGAVLEGMTTEEATAKLKGPRNTKVHIKVLREGAADLLTFDITRDVIKEQSSLCFYLPEHQICYLSLTIFTDNAVKQLKTLLEQLQKKRCKALMLDLRNNSGGVLPSAIAMASLFLDKGSVVVVTKDNTHKETERYETKEKPIIQEDLPIFVLINNFTASAAEILGGTLKVHAQELSKQAKNGKQKKLMVFLTGTKTFGKGSVQEVIPLSNNCALKLTTNLYFLPFDNVVQGIGIEPDFTIERKLPQLNQTTWFTKFYGREKALKNHISLSKDPEAPEAKKEVESKDKSWTERAKDMLDQDNQVRDTITLINIFHAAKTCCPDQVATREKAVNYMKSIFLTTEKLDWQEVK